MKNKKGITLIALIITIIVMLILAGVSISIVVNEDFFGKANEANEMNENAINKAEQEEENALKQDVGDDFKVDDDFFAISGIDIYQYKSVEIKKVENNAEKTIATTNQLQKIDYSLSKFLEETEDNNYIYFRAVTNRTSLSYSIIDSDNNNIEYKYMTQEDTSYSEQDVDYIGTTLSQAAEGTTTLLIRVKVGDLKEKLDGLKIKVKNSVDMELYTLNFEYIEKTEDSEIKIPNGESVWFGKNYSSDKHIDVEGYEIENEEGQVDEMVHFSNKTAITDKYTFNEATEVINPDGTTRTEMLEKSKYATINQVGNTFITLNPANYSSIKENVDDLKLYLVQEKDTVNSKTIYMTDYPVTVYNPVKEVEITTTNLPYVITNVNGEEIRYNANYKEIDDADIDSTKTNLKITDCTDNIKDKFYVENKRIKSTITSDQLEGELNDYLDVKVTVEDIGGNSVSGTKSIGLGFNNFEVLASNGSNKEDKDRFKSTLKEAYEYAVTLGPGSKIIQHIKSWDHNSTTWDGSDGNFEITLNNLTYDLNENTLNFSSDKNLIIPNGIKFTLISSPGSESIKPDKNGKTHHINGSINFNHDTTFRSESIVKYISREDFLSRPEYKKYESIGTWLKSEGESDNIWNKIKYTGLYTTRIMKAYREYLNSFNMIGFNVNYKHSMSGIINYGTFNFESGKIIVETDEKVMAIGAFGGGAVLSIADGFLKILDALGIETASITEYTASYAKIENTGVGVENHGKTTLGKEDAKGIQEDTNPFPEIHVLVESMENGIGLSVGSITKPNQAISRAYGVWNKVSTASTTMNSGFIEMSILNKTNNWVSLGVGRAYGIFNDWGTTTINGFTSKNVQLDLALWGLDNVNKVIGDYEIDVDAGKIQQNLTKLLQDVNAKIKEKWTEFETVKMDGFFTASTQQILYKVTGGATTCYTDCYAVANADGRKTFIREGNGDDGITFGGGLKLANKELEVDTKNLWGKLDIQLPLYYVIYEDINGNNQYDEGEPESDYNLNVFQSIVNPLNYYLDFNTIVGSGISLGLNVFNNIFASSWIGQDFQDENLISNILRLSVRGVLQLFQ